MTADRKTSDTMEPRRRSDAGERYRLRQAANAQSRSDGPKGKDRNESTMPVRRKTGLPVWPTASTSQLMFWPASMQAGVTTTFTRRESYKVRLQTQHQATTSMCDRDGTPPTKPLSAAALISDFPTARRF